MDLGWISKIFLQLFISDLQNFFYPMFNFLYKIVLKIFLQVHFENYFGTPSCDITF